MTTEPLAFNAHLTRRKICSRCARPATACLCSFITEIAPVAEVVILQHPLESFHPKGSARLLHLCLPGSHLVTGEVFGHEHLYALLHHSLDEQSHECCARQPMLLYPDGPALPQSPFVRASTAPVEKLRLIIIDATWRKSRKMLHLNPLLQTLPRLSLASTPASRYLIRRAHRPGQLSTLEATCYALSMLENDEKKYDPLLESFDGFISRQGQWFQR